MASMVAKPSSSSVTLQEKGSRNKRKFRAEPPLGDPGKIVTLPQSDCSSYEFSADKFEIASTSSCHGQTAVCDGCSASLDHSDSLKLDLGLSTAIVPYEAGPSRAREEPEADEFQDADWSDLTETQLEELVLSNLDSIFKSAIKKIVAYGYTEEIVTRAVLRSGLCYGSKDPMSNIVDNTLTFLRSGEELDPLREHWFEDLQQLEKYVLAELVCVLREVRPFFSIGDAMWCLLICDMNVSHACAMDGDILSNFVDDSSNTNSSTPTPTPTPTPTLTPTPTPQHKVETKSSDLHLSDPSKPVPSSQPETPTKPIEGTNFAPETAETKPFTAAGTSQSLAQEEKSGSSSSRRVHSMSTKREYMLRQKSLHLDKNYRTYASKGSSRSGKLSSLLMDRKLKAVSDSTTISLKNASLKISKAMGVDAPDESGNNSVSAPKLDNENTLSAPKIDSQSQSIVPPSDSQHNALPAADTELSLSLSTTSTLAMVPYDKSPAQWVPQDKKDEMILKMASRARELQNQMQEWTEWANQKVMQAARRLGKDKEELKTLRQEKEEVERLKKEKQALEENTMKKLSEMENALCKASGQVERANSTIRRLEVENAVLRREMEAAKLRATESAASCQEVSKREKRALVEFQAWEKRKSFLREELVMEKRKLSQLLGELEQAKALQERFEVRWHQEETANKDLLSQASSMRKEKEQIETSTKSEEDMIKLKAENSVLKYKDDIQKLEKEISKLRLKRDSSKIAALRRGIDGSYASKLAYIKNSPDQRESREPYSSSEAFAGLHVYLESGGVKRERECVMCLSEEMAVVFLPCAHQVVCTTCNELHEKQGMKDCPSCRSPIQRRISIRYARSS